MTTALPLTLLTGFLGAGKTTLLKGLLRRPEFRRTAIVVGEFGEIAIDHHLIRPLGQGVTLIDGCPCCTLQDDLVTTLQMLWRQRVIEHAFDFDHIILETSGLSEPGPILNALLLDPLLAGRFEPRAVLCAADAMHLAETLDRRPECRRQIALASRLILTKADLTDEAGIKKATTLLRGIAASTPIHVARNGTMENADNLLNDGAWLSVTPMVTPDHASTIQSFALTADRPLEWKAVVKTFTDLLAAHGTAILRIKGLLNIAGRDNPTVIHAIQHALYPPEMLPTWPDSDRRSGVVFIVENLERAAVEKFWCPLITERQPA